MQLIDRLCSQTLRTNEEDRLYGMISLAVRATIRYRGAEFRPDVIDDAVQDSLDAMIEDCPELTAEDSAKRLTMAIEMISDATTKVLQDFETAQKNGGDSQYPRRRPDQLTAADLSEELSSQEIDQWLESLPPRQRALSLFLYASDVTPREVAAAVGEGPLGFGRQAGAGKSDLMRILRQEWEPPSPVSHGGPAIQFRVSGQGLGETARTAAVPAQPAAANLAGAANADSGPAASASLDPPSTAAASPPAPTDNPASVNPSGTNPAGSPPGPPAAAPAIRGVSAGGGGLLPALQVTGISDDIYAGWSLIATGHNLARGQPVAITEPLVLEPDGKGIKRMVVTDIVEIGDPRAATRHFLLKAYALDGDKDAAGLHETFHVGGSLDNAEARKTLANASLSSIEVARCLWHDFGTAEDPGLCR
ncbi:MAG: hypothetical protein JO258_07115 [Alphaproteobacteria bacterium]|nr:hypothetical protein [Alphaproteobacteria bacterium]